MRASLFTEMSVPYDGDCPTRLLTSKLTAISLRERITSPKVSPRLNLESFRKARKSWRPPRAAPKRGVSFHSGRRIRGDAPDGLFVLYAFSMRSRCSSSSPCRGTCSRSPNRKLASSKLLELSKLVTSPLTSVQYVLPLSKRIRKISWASSEADRPRPRRA
jgi:hypothetical protein